MTLPFVIYGASTSGVSAAWRAADGGSDVDLLEGSYEKFYMWVTGLLQTDRENVFKLDTKTSLRWGIASEILRRAAKIISPPDGVDSKGRPLEYILIAQDVMLRVFNSLINDFATPKSGKGVIRLRLNAPLEAVTKDPVSNAIVSIKCGGVVYPGLNFHDATDEGDLGAMAGCMMSFGRNAAITTKDITSGVRDGDVTTARSMNLTTGRRHKWIRSRSSKAIGDADRKPMAFCMRTLVTYDDARLKWEDLNIYGYDPSDYDADYEVAKAEKIVQPFSISGNAMDGSGVYAEFDMNNGGLGKDGFNWIGQFLNWFNMTQAERLLFRGDYTRHKAGLFKAIRTEQRWKDLPRVDVKDKDADGNTITVSKHIVEEVGKIGLIPGFFTKTLRTANTAVALGDVQANNGLLYLCIKAGTTGGGTGPVDMGLNILDGAATVPAGPNGVPAEVPEAGVRWRYIGSYVPGMSPMIYVREGRRVVGQDEQAYDDVTAPEKNVLEPVTAYGYPHADAHWVWRYGNERGFITYEGGSGLAGGQDIVATIMKWGSLKARYRDCPNLTFSRATSGTKQGWLVSRLELCYIKFGDVCGTAAAVAFRLGKYTGDLIYKSELRPALELNGAILTLPAGA